MVQVPAPLAAFFSFFPLHSYPPIPIPGKVPLTTPTLWISPPRPSALPPTDDAAPAPLSADVECLKWQAYLALRAISGIKVRWDVAPEGAIDTRLPNLHVPMAQSLEPVELRKTEGSEDGELLAAHMIPTWADFKLGVDSRLDPLEGYKDEQAKDESRAWVSLLEGVVHAALLISQTQPSYLHTLLFSPPSSTTLSTNPLQSLLSPPPAPLTGLFSLIPPSGTRVSPSAILSQYRDAIASLSERLGTDKWFLGSAEPTPLDALTFAYLHCILHSKDAVRVEVDKRVNLVAWEQRVRGLVRAAFT